MEDKVNIEYQVDCRTDYIPFEITGWFFFIQVSKTKNDNT